MKVMIGLQRNLDPNEGGKGGGTNIDDVVDIKELGLGANETPEDKIKRETAEAETLRLAEAEKLKTAEALKAELIKLGLAENATKEEIETARKKALEGAGAPAQVATELELDGKIYKINDKGEAVDETGKIIKTKAEVDAIAEQQDIDDKPLVQELLEKSGYKILDDKGKPKVYEDTIEGMLQFTKDVAILQANEAEKKFFELYPDVKEFAGHLQRGGTKADYFKRESEAWGNIKFDEKNEDLLKSVVIADLIKTGMSKEQAEATAQLYKDTDKLKTFGKDAHTRLVTQETNAKKAEEENYNKLVEEEGKRVDAYWTQTHEIIKKGSLNNIIIPEADREPFFEYLSIDVTGKGESKAFLNRQKLPAEQLLQLEYLAFKGFNLKDLIENTARTQSTRTLRSRITDKVNGNGDGEGGQTGVKVVKPADVNITLDTIGM